jgi:hypothetical protein
VTGDPVSFSFFFSLNIVISNSLIASLEEPAARSLAKLFAPLINYLVRL